MADLIKKIKIKKQDGTFTDYIPIGAEAKNISTNDGDSVELKLSKKPYYYNSVADMKADTKLKIGDMAITLGYYEENDGGGATYKIIGSTSLTPDDGTIVTISNNLYAIMIIEKNSVDIRQLGGKKELATDEVVFDNQICMTRYLSALNNFGEKYELYIPTGVWAFSETLISRWGGVIIRGDKPYPRDPETTTTIVPLADGQKFIWKVGGNANIDDLSAININAMTTCCHFEGLCFRTRFFGKSYSVTRACFYIDCTMYMTFEDIYVFNFSGNGMAIRTSWELNFKTLMFRGQIGFDSSCLLLANKKSINGVAPNISAVDIDTMLFEAIDGKYIYSEPDSEFSHNHIGHINIETAWGEAGDSSEQLTFSSDVSDCTPIDMISGFFRFLVIDSINLVYNDPTIITKGENRYYIRSLFRDRSSDVSWDHGKRFFVSVSNIMYRTNGNRSKVAVFSANYSYEYNGFTVGTLSFQDALPEKIFDCNYSLIPIVGNILRVNTNGTSMLSQNDAYLYASKRNVCYDETAPVRNKLVARRLPSSSSSSTIIEWPSEKQADTTNPLTFTFVVKNNTTDSFRVIVLYTVVNGERSSTRINVPINDNNWQTISVQRAVDFNTAIWVWASGNPDDISIAKVYY